MISILVVEDNRMTRRMFEGILPKLGLRPVLAANGEEAVELYRANAETVSAVLLDLNLDGQMDGLDTLVALRSINAQLPCCFMSASAPDDVLNLPEPVFRKPFSNWDDVANHLKRIAQVAPQGFA